MPTTSQTLATKYKLVCSTSGQVRQLDKQVQQLFEAYACTGELHYMCSLRLWETGHVQVLQVLQWAGPGPLLGRQLAYPNLTVISRKM
jgi:hypothetical protein